MSLSFVAVSLLLAQVGAQPSQGHFPAVRELPQKWVSTGLECGNTDSLAYGVVAGKPLVFATAKEGDRIDVLDAATGKFLRHLGESGEEPGQFDRPNGIAFVTLATRPEPTPALLVVERNNHRIQVVHAGTGKSLLIFGEDLLDRPYGVSVRPAKEDGVWDVFITDTEVVSDDVINHYHLNVADNRPAARFVHHFGDGDADARILTAESIAVDPATGWLLVCEEQIGFRRVKSFSPDGSRTGPGFGQNHLVGEPEGIATLPGQERTVVVLTDQSDDLTRWHVYRATSADLPPTFEYVLSFTGAPRIRNTDGITIGTLPGQAAPMLFAVDDDCQVRAYPLQPLLGWLAPAAK